MINASLFTIKKPRLEYNLLTVAPPIQVNIPPPKKVTLYCDRDQEAFEQKEPVILKTGERVKAGQKLLLFEDRDACVISPVAGSVAEISSYVDDSGRSHISVLIDAIDMEEFDDRFITLSREPTLENVGDYLASLPGKPPIEVLSDSDRPIHTLIICGIDGDLFVNTNQFIVRSNIDAIKNGIRILKTMSGIEHVVMVVPREIMQGFGAIGAEVKAVDTEYPAALPHMIMKDILGKVVPAGKSCEDMGVVFFKAEAVASIGIAFGEGRLPFMKILTLIKKDGSQSLVSVKIGAPIRDIFAACDVTLREQDRIIIGGPMTGSTLYSEDHPVQPDTDAIVVQDKEDLMPISDYPCINCGECVRICPVRVPVNMLIRFLEAGQFEEAADQYDLYSCIECGLCSFVCVSRMPVFQYIRLAKSELAKTGTAETNNAYPV